MIIIGFSFLSDGISLKFQAGVPWEEDQGQGGSGDLVLVLGCLGILMNIY